MGEPERLDLDDLALRFEAIGQEDWDTAAELLDPDVAWHDPPDLPDATVYRGVAAVRRMWAEEMFDAWERWSLDLKELIPAGDKILSHCRMHAKAKHTGIEQDLDLFQVWTFRIGRVIEQRSFFDRSQANKAAGLGD
ncbi:MAG: nuclear transport factor 2 family protein [Solirubrobacterales bacterium]